MSDQQVTEWLRSLPREKSAQQVWTAEQRRDQERGPYIPHHHHVYYGESRH